MIKRKPTNDSDGMFTRQGQDLDAKSQNAVAMDVWIPFKG
jgi:hypothetical protein